MKLKEKLSDILKNILFMNLELIMEKGASLVCTDKEGAVRKSIKLVATHIDHDADIQIDFPQFDIMATTSKDGLYSVNNKHILTLDTDSQPTEGSKKLLTSGQLYDIINDLQNQIDTLKQKLNK